VTKDRAQNGLEGFLGEIHEETLPNGIRFLFRRRKKSPLTTFHVWYRVGSRNEAVGRTGISHILEHMMFKGTDRVGPEEFSRIIQREGGQTNAFTTKDTTAYYAVLASERLTVALDLERDRMRNIRLRSRDFESERRVVMEERRLRTDTQPEAVLQEEVEAQAFHSHPYRWPIIGWMEDIEGITLSDVRRFRRTHYAPPNLFLVAVGNREPGEMLDLVSARFGDIPGGKPAPRVSVTEPGQRAHTRITLRREAQVPYLVMAHHVPRLGHPDGLPLEVLACVLATGRSARLYRRLVKEEALALHVEAENSLLSVDPSLFTIAARILPGESMERAEETILEEISHVAAGITTDEELARAKGQLEAALVFSLDSLMTQALLMAQCELCGGWRLLGDYLLGIRGVTLADISRVTRDYLSEENRTTGWLIPREGGKT